jgi:hypothetical protein
VAVPRDASTVLLTTEHQRGWWKAPTAERLDPPTLLQHHTFRGAPVFHGGGLLPTGVSDTTFVAVRSVFKPSGSHWGIRHLTPKELLEAYGLPSLQVQALLAAGFTSWALLALVESLAVAAQLFLAMPDSILYTGGGEFSIA